MVKHRLIPGIFALVFTLSTTLLVAQEDKGSVYYVKSLVITQVAMGTNGYKVTYQNSRGKLYNTYIPHQWFVGTDRKAERINTLSPSAPYMDVYYRDGAFSHVRLFLISTSDHATWIGIDSDEDLSSNFSAEDLVVNYN